LYFFSFLSAKKSPLIFFNMNNIPSNSSLHRVPTSSSLNSPFLSPYNTFQHTDSPLGLKIDISPSLTVHSLSSHPLNASKQLGSFLDLNESSSTFIKRDPKDHNTVEKPHSQVAEVYVANIMPRNFDSSTNDDKFSSASSVTTIVSQVNSVRSLSSATNTPPMSASYLSSLLASTTKLAQQQTAGMNPPLRALSSLEVQQLHVAIHSSSKADELVPLPISYLSNESDSHLKLLNQTGRSCRTEVSGHSKIQVKQVPKVASSSMSGGINKSVGEEGAKSCVTTSGVSAVNNMVVLPPGSVVSTIDGPLAPGEKRKRRRRMHGMNRLWTTTRRNARRRAMERARAEMKAARAAAQAATSTTSSGAPTEQG
jgi:hypothetical protein